MDNFRKFPKRQKGKNSVDGFVRGGTMYNQQPSLHDFNRSYQPPGKIEAPTPRPVLQQRKLDDFKSPEGFRPAQNPALSSPSEKQSQREIIIEEEHLPPRTHEMEKFVPPTRHKKRLFRRKKDKHASSLVKKRRGWKLFALRATAGVLVIAVLLGGFLFAKGYLKVRGLLKGGGGAVALTKDVDPTKLKGEGDGRVNVLILGKGGEEHEAPDLTDSIILASINPIDKEAALLSIPRDLYVKSTSGGSSKINAVYANAKSAAQNTYRKQSNVNELAEKAGLEAIEKVVEDSMGVPVHYYVMIDFQAFRKAIDTVGGVDVYAKEALYDPMVAWENGGKSQLAVQGWNHFNGKQALLYSRSRSGSLRGDFDRAERQREVMLALKSKVMNAGTFTNPVKVSQLIDAFGDHMQTNLSLDEVMRVYEIAKELDGSKVASLGLADPPNSYVVTDNIGGQSVVVPRAGLYNFTEIKSFVRNAMRDGFLKSENASVVVLNGSGVAGLATRKADELKSYGYNVTRIDTAPTENYTKSVIIDMTNGVKKYTKRYLEQRFGVTAVDKSPDAAINTTGADFVIILGSESSQNTD